MITAKIHFIPQINHRGYCDEVEPIDSPDWEIPADTPELWEEEQRDGEWFIVEDYNDGADALACFDNAPQWVRDWASTHPFEVEIVNRDELEEWRNANAH